MTDPAAAPKRRASLIALIYLCVGGAFALTVPLLVVGRDVGATFALTFHAVSVGLQFLALVLLLVLIFVELRAR